MVTFILLEA
jgi:hypothetical protein